MIYGHGFVDIIGDESIFIMSDVNVLNFKSMNHLTSDLDTQWIA